MPTSNSGPRLIVVIGGNRCAHPIPLPGGQTPCAFVAMLGGLVSTDRRRAAWWIDPGRPARNPGNVGVDPDPTEAP